MKVKVHKRCDEDVAVLVDWHQLEPYWLNSTFAPVDRNKLADAYCSLWFDNSSSICSFTLGEIFFSQNKQGEHEISFSNGRHRTNLMIKHQQFIPVAMEEVSDHPAIQASIVKRLEEGDIVDIPDLPIYSITKMREMGL